MPKFISIRVWKKCDERMKWLYRDGFIPIPSIFGNEKSCDVWYRRNGEIEKALSYDFRYDKTTKTGIPVVCESYVSEIDEHGKVTRKEHEYKKSKRNPDSGKFETEVVKDIESYDNAYSLDGRLTKARKTSEYESGRTYVSDILFNENEDMIEQNSGNIRYRYLYDETYGTLLVGEEHYSVYQQEPNLFDSADVKEELMSRSKIEYDADGNQTMLMWMDGEDRPTNVRRIEYDNIGNVKLRTFISEGNTRFESVQNHVRSVLSGRTAPNGTINVRHTLELLNGNGDVVERTQMWSEKKPKKEGWESELHDKMTFEYRYDDEGNWLRKEVYRNGNLEYFIERTIDYYS